MKKLPRYLKKILLDARHAPSSHNTQPWTVRLDDPRLVIGYRPERHLRVGDPDKRELFISLGCFIKSIELSAKRLGYSATYNFLGELPEEVAVLDLKKIRKTDPVDWSKLIRLRRSDKRFYSKSEIPTRELSEIGRLKEGDSSTVITTEREQIEFLAKMTHDATLDIMSDPAFREELSNWVRHNWTKKADGMPAYTQGMPGPVSLVAKWVIRKNRKVAASQAKKDSKRVARSSAIGVICVNEQSPSNWIDAGRLYQSVCLESLRYGIKTTALSAAIVDSSTTKKIMKQLSLKNTPVAFIRFGYTKNTARATPRLRLNDFLIK